MARPSAGGKPPTSTQQYLADVISPTPKAPGTGSRPAPPKVDTPPLGQTPAPRKAPAKASRPAGDPMWGNPDGAGFAQSNIVSVSAGGATFQVNKLGAVQFQGFINALVARGYKPKSVQGYNNRNIAGTNSKSNHAYGASIDIDPGDNPQYRGGTGGRFALPPDVGQLAAQFGLVWGGDYTSSKDYMHFELAGAPSTPKALTRKVDEVVAQSGGLPRSIQAATQAAGAQAPLAQPALAGAMGADPAAGILGPDGKVDWRKAIAEYGFVAEIARSQPELAKLIENAAKGGWTDEEVAARLRETNYWRSTSDQQRATEILKKTNPGEYRRQRQQMIDKINLLARRLGVPEGSQRVFILAERFLSLGTPDGEIERLVAADARVAGSGAPGAPGAAAGNTGETAVTVDALRGMARSQQVQLDPRTEQQWVASVMKGDLSVDAYKSFLLAEAKKRNPDIPAAAFERGETVDSYRQKQSALVEQMRAESKQFLVPLSEDALKKWAGQVASGDVTPESFSSYIKEQAKSLFPTLGAAIDRGVTVAQYAEPYRQVAAQTLEINPDDVDFSNPMYSRALMQVDPKTGERTSMGLAEYQEYLRKQPQWQKTRQANEQAASLTESLLRTFGKTA